MYNIKTDTNIDGNIQYSGDLIGKIPYPNISSTLGNSLSIDDTGLYVPPIGGTEFVSKIMNFPNNSGGSPGSVPSLVTTGTMIFMRLQVLLDSGKTLDTNIPIVFQETMILINQNASVNTAVHTSYKINNITSNSFVIDVLYSSIPTHQMNSNASVTAVSLWPSGTFPITFKVQYYQK